MSVAQKDGITAGSAIDYTDLYRRWEKSNWSAYDIDFSVDREAWSELSEMQRRSALWTYSMFFYGEDSVTDNLSPYIEAAPREEQKYFLATQQVDEARHAIFFHRFFNEVIGLDGSIGETLDFTRQYHGWGYRHVFDRLDKMADELRRDRSLPKFAQAIALYHLVVEATLAQPGQHFIEDYFTKAGTLPGFSAGMKNVSRDEQRHIGFGVKVLSELFAESDECKAAVVELLREIMPYSVAVFVPPGWDLEYTRCYGFELEDIYAFGLKSVMAKWRATGYPLDEMPPDVFPLDVSLPAEEIAQRQIMLLKAGVTGEPNGRPDSSPEVQRVFFEMVARSANGAPAGSQPFTAQWRFSDAEPWHITVDNGSTRAAAGAAPAPDVTLEASWGDWIAVSMGDLHPGRAVLGRRLRLHGGPRSLMRFRRVFTPRSR
jgi:1,2-phenylacetyl-CoA epoxidase catalytic subunit